MHSKTNLSMIDIMKNLSQTEADAFAREWAAAWNSHDVDLIADHYRHDIQYYSPFAARLGARTPLSGRGGLRRYVAAALERYPSVQFGPDLVAAAGAEASPSPTAASTISSRSRR